MAEQVGQRVTWTRRMHVKKHLGQIKTLKQVSKGARRCLQGA